MATIDVEGYTAEARTSRKTRYCQNRGREAGCARIIQPGDRYVRHAATPRAEFNDGRRWSWMFECAVCFLGRHKGGVVG